MLVLCLCSVMLIVWDGKYQCCKRVMPYHEEKGGILRRTSFGEIDLGITSNTVIYQSRREGRRTAYRTRLPLPSESIVMQKGKKSNRLVQIS
ncbi:hypothetical protein TNIN_150821 [Trichonephila inaurata madagascariensis]|uniref:Secreted protein n=1 Tax=Trichonephila inaurata madagascariensis TaxID=2747483 RepID=A0A8X7CG17_9ARAC|nr:hypothetical protein TNIN_150821 [Trichonephila inaurata madagascariensis]